MKKFTFVDTNNNYTSICYVGKAKEIKALYKSLDRASLECKTSYYPLFADFPKFNLGKVYGLEIEPSTKRFTILNSDTVLKCYVL